MENNERARSRGMLPDLQHFRGVEEGAGVPERD